MTMSCTPSYIGQFEVSFHDDLRQMQRALFDSDIGQHVDTLLNKPQEPTKGGWEVRHVSFSSLSVRTVDPVFDGLI
jgi:hypothetical protein